MRKIALVLVGVFVIVVAAESGWCSNWSAEDVLFWANSSPTSMGRIVPQSDAKDLDEFLDEVGGDPGALIDRITPGQPSIDEAITSVDNVLGGTNPDLFSNSAAIQSTVGQGGADVTTDLQTVNNLIDPNVNPANLTTAVSNVAGTLGGTNPDLFSNSTAIQNTVGQGGADITADLQTVNNLIDPNVNPANLTTAVNNVAGTLGGANPDLFSNSTAIQNAVGQGGVDITADLQTVNNLIDPNVNPANLTTAVRNVAGILGGGEDLLARSRAILNDVDQDGNSVTESLNFIRPQLIAVIQRAAGIDTQFRRIRVETAPNSGVFTDVPNISIPETDDDLDAILTWFIDNNIGRLG